MTLLSFGFKHGIPSEADIVLDVRFLPNPFFVPDLSALSGEDEAVVRFVLDDPETKAFLEQGRALVQLSVAGVQARGEVVRHRRRSAAPAAATARSPSPRSWGGACGTGLAVSVRHRDIVSRGGSPGTVASQGFTAYARRVPGRRCRSVGEAPSGGSRLHGDGTHG